ncbi:MAG: prephenate dehydrogenase [Synergistaceae bacterium]|jgi:prephenate dehydrogenase|nr:prephenate dehydrogenase [Synergistaceae bacterium]
MSYRICVIGLGLMGASLAGALRGFRGASIAGADVLEDVRQKSESSGIVDKAFADAGEAINGADLVIFCVYAHCIPEIIAKNLTAFRPGVVISDICGVKSGLYAKLGGLLPARADYIGIHPMAGKERDGFDNADPAIYKNSGFIICPLPATKRESVELMKEVAGYIGATRLAVAPPHEHDAIIAYTSDLMHIAAAGLCAEYHPGITSAFTAGAFRDCTRVADINAGAWAELLTDNRAHTLACLDRYIDSLREMRGALAAGDEKKLRAILERAGENKREMLTR